MRRLLTCQTEAAYHCGSCGVISRQPESVSVFNLPVPEDAADTARPVSSLLARCLEPEVLIGENQYHCDGCGQLTDAVRRLGILVPPRILVLSLSRFGFELTSGRSHKLLAPVRLEGRLLLPLAEDTTATYCLYAAVVHAGPSLDAGHYYCLARPSDGGAGWWKLDDDLATRLMDTVPTAAGSEAEGSLPYAGTDPEQALGLDRPSDTAFLLFYRRCDDQESEQHEETVQLPDSLHEEIALDNRAHRRGR